MWTNLNYINQKNAAWNVLCIRVISSDPPCKDAMPDLQNYSELLLLRQATIVRVEIENN